MKMKKILALGLSMAMVLGVVAACDSSSSTTTTTTAATTAATTEAPKADDDKSEPEETQAPVVEVDEDGGLVGFNDLGAAEVANEGDKLEVWSFNTEVQDLMAGKVDAESGVEQWPAYTSVAFDYQEVGGGDQAAYRSALDQALAAGTAPDLFACDADYAQLYMNSDNTIAINSIGLKYGDCANMYNYTLQFAADDEGVIKGLAWQACPCGVFYNRSLAQEYLGVSEPEDVAAYFATWDKFIETAEKINTDSEGKVKIVSSIDDLWRPYQNTRKTPWIVDGELNIDPAIEAYFDIAKVLKDDELTFETGMWNDSWTGNAANSSTLSYFGPMWLGLYSINLNADSNPTKGDWGMVKAPSSYYWGGTWLMASKDCDMKKDAGQVVYDLTLDQDHLMDYASKSGEFVNSIPVMETIANDPSFGLDWLGGQNPASVLLASATTIDNSAIGPNDGTINDAFTAAVNSYVAGDIASVADAKASFEANLKDLDII